MCRYDVGLSMKWWRFQSEDLEHPAIARTSAQDKMKVEVG